MLIIWLKINGFHFPTPEDYILGKIRTTMTSRSHIPPVSNKAHGIW